MEVLNSNVANSIPVDSESNYDRTKEVKAFEETKAGVKGLVDFGVTRIPRFFVHSPENLQKSSTETSNISLHIPTIDFEGRRIEVVNEIRKTSEEWGFFQLVNQGIPDCVMDEMLAGVRRFHEQPQKDKIDLYSRDRKEQVMFFSRNLPLTGAPAQWRDSILLAFRDGKLDPELIPETLREEVGGYIRHLKRICKTLSELLSEALGLSCDYLSNIECMETQTLVRHYYPACPEPHLTIGPAGHTDPSFLTIRVQDNMGDFQVRHQNQWVDVPPQQGVLLVNIGDLMQLITNDKFRSVEHRVLVGDIRFRTSVGCFFYPSAVNAVKTYEVIKELLSDNSPIYRETNVAEFMG